MAAANGTVQPKPVRCASLSVYFSGFRLPWPHCEIAKRITQEPLVVPSSGCVASTAY
jgi:hypothetical protein